MATPPNTIEEEVLGWPAERRLALAEKLVASVEDFAAPEIAAAWNAEIGNRLSEIREGRAIEIPAEQVHAEARSKLREARRISSTGRRRTG